MTSPRTPDEEPGAEQTRAESPDQPSAPPPPQWLEEDQQPSGAPLLPEPLPPLPDSGPPPQDPQGKGAPAEGSQDKTVSNIDANDAMRTQVFTQGGQGSQSGQGSQGGQTAAPSSDAERTAFIGSPGPASPAPSPQPPSPQPPSPQSPAPRTPSPEATMVDGTAFSRPPVTGGAPDTEVEGPAGQQPAPPREQQHASPPPPPFPYAQEIPSAQPAPPVPFPYAQEIPGNPPAPAPASPPAPEPFPYAQEIPGQPANPAPAAAPPPFPYAQEIPGTPGSQGGPAQTSPPAPIAPPPTIDEPWRTPSTGKKKKSKQRTSSRSKKPLFIGLGGLAAAAVLAAGGFVVLSGGGDDAEGGTGATLAGKVFPVDSAARTDGRDQEITSVASVGTTTVAVGGESDAQRSRGLFLVSGDGGRTFRQAELRGEGRAEPGPGEVPVAVGGSARGWVAIGTRPGGGVVWTSENGQTWRRLPDAVGDVFAANQRVRRVVATTEGFFALGDSSAKGDFSDAEPVIWSSADAQRWEARAGEQMGLEIQKGKLSLVTAAASGKTILLEAVHTPDPKKRAAFRRVWLSEDGGRTWANSPVPVPKKSRGLMIGGGAAGFLAMREIKDGDKSYGQAFTSKDGRSWTEGGKLETPGYRRVSQVMADERGYAALVVRGRDVLISRSTDGGTWRDAGFSETQPQRVVVDAALAGDQTILAGREPGSGDVDALLGVWDARGSRVAMDPSKVPGAMRADHSVIAVEAGGDQAVAVGSAAGDAAVWTSRDGTAWKASQGLGAAFTRPGPQQLLGVTGGKSGWLAVGYDQAVGRRPLVVTSSDGATWQAADTAAAFRSGGTAAATSGTPGYVIVGADGTSAATWFSADLKTWERGKSASSDALEAGSTEGKWMLDAASGTFGYAAVGGVRVKDTGNVPAVWTSSNGKQWALQQLPLPKSGATEGHLTHVTARGNSLVAAGLAATPQGLVWLGYVSADGGKTWRELAVPGGDPKVRTTSLAATPNGFAATGVISRPGGSDVVSWTSADGSAWSATTPGGEGLGGNGEQQITGLSPFKGRLLGVGSAADSAGDQPVLWIRPVP
ncbi:sialidase family protein [Actinomadura rudentiformis]|uniref:sialidase family protein n=1 Tax=Actinomadura rudentiformis TaxID=359158 RepID=UPI00178C5A69|nr:sialidase family protein [Actinomadura rudentiformis]